MSSHRDDQEEALTDLHLFGADVPAEQDFARTYRAGVRAALKWFVVAARYAAWLRDAKSYAAEHGWALPVVLPDLDVDVLDIGNPTSGLCDLIRQAKQSGFVSGEESWLLPANWNKGEQR